MLGSPPSLLNDLICPQQERLWDAEAERFGRLEIDYEVELAGLLDRQAGRLRALENLVDEGRRAPLQVEGVGAVDHETTSLYVLPLSIDRRQASLRCELRDLFHLVREDGVRENQERARPLPGHRREGDIDLPGIPRLQSLKPHPQGPSRAHRLAQLGCAPWIVRIPEEGHPRDPRNRLLEHLELFPD